MWRSGKAFPSQVSSTLQGRSCAWQCYTPGKLACKRIGHGPISASHLGVGVLGLQMHARNAPHSP